MSKVRIAHAVVDAVGIAPFELHHLRANHFQPPSDAANGTGAVPPANVEVRDGDGSCGARKSVVKLIVQLVLVIVLPIKPLRAEAAGGIIHCSSASGIWL